MSDPLATAAPLFEAPRAPQAITIARLWTPLLLVARVPASGLGKWGQIWYDGESVSSHAIVVPAFSSSTHYVHHHSR